LRVFRNSTRARIVSALGLLVAGMPQALADSPGADPTASAYSVLQRHGLLVSAAANSAPSTPARRANNRVVAARIPAPQTLATSQPVRSERPVTAPSLNTLSESEVLPRAYQRLRALGLLKSEPGARTSPAIAMDTRPKADRVVVDKSERKLFLMRNGKPFREFRISLGRAPEGPKLREGDNRTPEGVYTLDWRNPKSGFYKSMHISYPNDDDRLRAQKLGVSPGGNIMIHGEHYIPSLSRIYRMARNKDWTEGCIAIHNEDMDELWVTVADGTPIEIRP
jgi:lipoprotein-anchoring transpeptidase ErfK/SrfK